MNKLAVTTLESKFHVFDTRTQHPTKGFASVTERVRLLSKTSLILEEILVGYLSQYIDEIVERCGSVGRALDWGSKGC